MAKLLAQDLHNNDTCILASVLDRADLEMTGNTVKRIPAEAVVALVSLLQKTEVYQGEWDGECFPCQVVEGSADHLHQIPYLCSFSLLSDDLLETRTQHYNQVLQLRGRLELLTRQAMDMWGNTMVDTENQALLVLAI